SDAMAGVVEEPNSSRASLAQPVCQLVDAEQHVVSGGVLDWVEDREAHVCQGAPNACDIVERVLQWSDGIRIGLVADQEGEALLRKASAAKEHPHEHDEQNGQSTHSPIPRTHLVPDCSTAPYVMLIVECGSC